MLRNGDRTLKASPGLPRRAGLFFCRLERMDRRSPLVIPGCATWRRPGIHTHDRGYGFRARSLRSRPGMTPERFGQTLSPQERGEGAKRSQPQHRLGDDVALDLVGAAVDRDLAVVEIARRDLRGPVHRLVAAVVAVNVVG